MNIFAHEGFIASCFSIIKHFGSFIYQIKEHSFCFTNKDTNNKTLFLLKKKQKKTVILNNVYVAIFFLLILKVQP